MKTRKGLSQTPEARLYDCRVVLSEALGLGCMSAMDKKSAYYFVNIIVLVFLIGQKPECPGYD